MFDTGMRLEQKQTLKLNMQMLQSLEMMTLPLAELKARIEEERSKNPTLDVTEPQDSISLEEYYSKQKTFEGRSENYSDSSAYGSDISDSHNAWLEGAVSEEETLQEHLLKQLGVATSDENIIRIGEIIISSLDSNGFFTKPLNSLIKKSDFGYVDETLELLHTFDPIGIAVDNFRESLIVQAKNLGLRDEELKAFTLMVENELENLKNGKIKETAKNIGTDEEEVEVLYSFLRTLNPYPGAAYASGYEHLIVPDISIKREDGKLVMRLNDYDLPLLSIDSEYQEMVKELSNTKNAEEKEAAKYLKKEIQSATTLIDQVNLRSQTLEKVGKVLLEKQKGFFLFGPQSLKPLTLKMVAEEIGMHETTISRITTNKYIDTDFGIMPLKSLFSAALQSRHDEEGISRNAVKDMVREIIENNTGKPLSDQKISDMLKDKGISCARRTVSKYRKELDIDSSFERKN